MDNPGEPTDSLHDQLRVSENVTLDSDREKWGRKAGDAVTLITMHSCKGLEFPMSMSSDWRMALLHTPVRKWKGTLGRRAPPVLRRGHARDVEF